MQILLTFFVFIFGAVIGSFLNVVILRLKANKRLDGRSACPACHHQLDIIDLIPIVSYLLLSGKCRYCGHTISWQYPAVEALTAITFALIFLYAGYLATFTWIGLLGFVFALFVVSVLIIVSVYDLRWGLIPDKVILPASLVALAYLIVVFVVSMFSLFASTPELVGSETSFTQSPFFAFGLDLLTALLIGLFFLALIVFTRGKGMGGGDLKLSIFLGLALGFPGAIIGLLLAFLTGATASIILLLSGKKGLKSTVPFGPFLALGAYLAMVFGAPLWTAYLHVLGFN